MKYLSDKYVSIYSYKGFDICILEVAVPADGDELGYLIDSKQFRGKVFNDVESAIAAIDLIMV